MLPRPARLGDDHSIQMVLRRGRVGRGTFVTIKATILFATSARRGTVVVSKKVSKKATDRNVIKRRLRPLLQRSLPQFPAGVGVVVLVQPVAKTATAAALRDDFASALAKLFRSPTHATYSAGTH